MERRAAADAPGQAGAADDDNETLAAQIQRERREAEIAAAKVTGGRS
jgi:hypothetical protein